MTVELQPPRHPWGKCCGPDCMFNPNDATYRIYWKNRPDGCSLACASCLATARVEFGEDIDGIETLVVS